MKMYNPDRMKNQNLIGGQVINNGKLVIVKMCMEYRFCK